jgi:hypothetical protein
MKNSILILILLASVFAFSQKEGQNFCKGDTSRSYFDLDILKKKIYWYNTYYFEEQTGSKIIKEKKYLEFKQVWENGNTDFLYLREEDGITLEFEDGFDKETIRFNRLFKVNHSWEKEDNTAIYTVKSFEGKLKTPYCKYENLLIIEAKYKKVTFNFFYLKGFGYVGATKNEDLISYVTPEM